MENVVVVMPEIVPYTYNGQKVFTSVQLVTAYGCKKNRIKDNFYNHKADFVEGVDYFKIVGEELNQFKLQNAGRFSATANEAGRSSATANEAGRSSATANEAGRSSATAFMSSQVTNLILWTQSGAFKHSQFINTPIAKAVFEKLSQAFFYKLDAAQEIEPLQILNPEIFNRVYAMELSDGTVKIGRSSNVERRVKQIESENGVQVLRVYNTDFLPLEIAAKIEFTCHKFFAAFLAHDKEYFNVTLEDACAAIDNFTAPPQFEPPALNPREKYELLQNIFTVKDEVLREQLLKKAVEIWLV